MSYAGFLLPLLLAALAGVATYTMLLLGVAAVCLASLLAVARGLRITRP